MGKQVAAGLKKGLQLSWLERTPDKREVGGSSPLKPIGLKAFAEKRKGPLKLIGLKTFIEKRKSPLKSE